MNLLFRTDASVAIGTGHVMRCLALGQAWSDAGGRAIFAMAAATSAIEKRLRSEGFEVTRVTGPVSTQADAGETIRLARRHSASWVVVDGYEFGAEYQAALKSAGLRVLFIDDNGHAAHYSADLVLNQNAHSDEALYRSRESSTHLLLGPRYALLRREFADWGAGRREVPAVARKVLVTMGGSDPGNLTRGIIEALTDVEELHLEITVVVGGSNPYLPEIKDIVDRSQRGIRLLRDVTNMPDLMAWADLAISAAGSTCWELCALALPALLIAVAPNQKAAGLSLQQLGAAKLILEGEHFRPDLVREAVALINSPVERQSLSDRAHALVDAKGAGRVVAFLCSGRLPREEVLISLRDVTPNDQDKIREWRNNPGVRKYMYTDHEIGPDEHRLWFSRILRDPSCKYWVIVCDGDDVGLANLYNIDNRNRRCYWGFYVIGASARGKAVGSFAEFSVLRFVFEDLKFQKLCAEVLASNQAVIRMHKSFGFEQEGVFRKHIFKGDAFVDVVSIALLREDWDAKKAELELKLRAKADI